MITQSQYLLIDKMPQMGTLGAHHLPKNTWPKLILSILPITGTIMDFVNQNFINKCWNALDKNDNAFCSKTIEIMNRRDTDCYLSIVSALISLIVFPLIAEAALLTAPLWGLVPLYFLCSIAKDTINISRNNDLRQFLMLGKCNLH